MLMDDIEFSKDRRYSVIRLNDSHITELKGMLRDRLAQICYGEGCIETEPDEYTYHKACKHLWSQLSGISSQRQYAIVAEIIMHLVSPSMLHFEVEPLSVALALQDKNIKHGFDINFLELQNKRIWYGEVKSGCNQSRSILIGRAHDDLKKYFENIESDGDDDTSYRWEAAKNEARVIFSANTAKVKEVVRLLTESRNGILNGKKDKRNAIIMAVNFGVTGIPCDHLDIERYIKKTDKKHIFDNHVVLSVAKEQVEDIILFLRQEGGGDD